VSAYRTATWKSWLNLHLGGVCEGFWYGWFSSFHTNDLGISEAAHGFQAPAVWVDANGNAHSSPPEAPPAAGTVEAAPPYTSLSARRRASGSGVTTPEAAGTAPANSYLLWQDPGEGAFSVSLPMGWRISGGTVRSTKSRRLPRAGAVARCGAKLFMDDPGILMREVPQPGNGGDGREDRTGAAFRLGSSLIVEPYRPGDQFAAEYVKQILCPSATMILGGPIADQTQALNAPIRPSRSVGGKSPPRRCGRAGVQVRRAHWIRVCHHRTGNATGRPGGDLGCLSHCRLPCQPADSRQPRGSQPDAWHIPYEPDCCRATPRKAATLPELWSASPTLSLRPHRPGEARCRIQASIESSRHNSASIPNGAAGCHVFPSSTNRRQTTTPGAVKNVCDDLGHAARLVLTPASPTGGAIAAGYSTRGPNRAAAAGSQSACWSKGR